MSNLIQVIDGFDEQVGLVQFPCHMTREEAEQIITTISTQLDEDNNNEYEDEDDFNSAFFALLEEHAIQRVFVTELNIN